MDYIQFQSYKVDEAHKNEFIDDARKGGLDTIIYDNPLIFLEFAECVNTKYDVYLVRVHSKGKTVINPETNTPLPLPIICIWDRIISAVTYFPFDTDKIHKHIHRNIPYIGERMLITKYYPGLDAMLLPVYNDKTMIGYTVVTDETVYSKDRSIDNARKVIIDRYNNDVIRDIMIYQSTSIEQRYFKFKIGLLSDDYDMIHVKKNYAVVAAYGTGVYCKANKCTMNINAFSIEHPLEDMYNVADIFKLDIDDLIICEGESIKTVRDRLNKGNAYITDHSFDTVIDQASAVIGGTIEYADFVGDVLLGITVETYSDVGELLTHTIVSYPRAVYRTDVIAAVTKKSDGTNNLKSLTDAFIKRWITGEVAENAYRLLINSAYKYESSGEFITDAMDHAESESNLKYYSA